MILDTMLAYYDERIQPRLDRMTERLTEIVRNEHEVAQDAWDRLVARLPTPAPRRARQLIIGGIATMAAGGELISLTIAADGPLAALAPALPAIMLTGPAGFIAAAFGVRGLKREVAAIRARRNHPASKGFVR